jgi:SAM-dependent methyltransferase
MTSGGIDRSAARARGGRVTSSCCPGCGADAFPDRITLGGYQLFACPRCTLRFAPQAFHVPVDYDRLYESAEYKTDQVQALQSLGREELADHPTYRSFFRRVRHVPGAKLLDVGCGVGRFCQGAHGHGWNVTGIDVSARAIETGRTLAPFPLRVATTEELLQGGERFDVVTAFEVVEHLSDPVEFLASTGRLVYPGGQLFITVPNWSSAVVQKATRPDWVPPVHLLFFTEAALRQAGERSGLTRVTTGIIWSDPLPARAPGRARWLLRRLLRRPREPLGLWMHGWVGT